MRRGHMYHIVHAGRGGGSRKARRRRGAAALSAVRRARQRALPWRPRGRAHAMRGGAAASVRQTLRAAAAVRQPLRIRHPQLWLGMPSVNGCWCASTCTCQGNCSASISHMAATWLSARHVAMGVDLYAIAMNA